MSDAIFHFMKLLQAESLIHAHCTYSFYLVMFQLLNRRDDCGHDPPSLPLPAGEAAAGGAGEVFAAGDQPPDDRYGSLLW